MRVRVRVHARACACACVAQKSSWHYVFNEILEKQTKKQNLKNMKKDQTHKHAHTQEASPVLGSVEI